MSNPAEPKKTGRPAMNGYAGTRSAAVAKIKGSRCCNQHGRFVFEPGGAGRFKETMMKVKELIEALTAANPEAEVILQKDGEGNSYSPLYTADMEAVYVPDSTWSGDVYSLAWTADDACKSPDEWAAITSKPRCVVLAPVN